MTAGNKSQSLRLSTLCMSIFCVRAKWGMTTVTGQSAMAQSLLPLSAWEGGIDDGPRIHGYAYALRQG